MVEGSTYASYYTTYHNGIISAKILCICNLLNDALSNCDFTT